MKKSKIISIVLGVIITVSIVAFFSFKDKNPLSGLETEKVIKTNIQKIINETGIVKATQQADLSFDTSGIISSISVIEGQEVKKGQIIANIDNQKLNAEYASALANIKAAEAQLLELTNGSTANEQNLAQTSLISSQTLVDQAVERYSTVQTQQNQLVEIAKKNLFTTDIQAYLIDGTNENTAFNFSPPVITGSYNNTTEGEYRIKLYPSASSSGYSFTYSGLENGTAPASSVSSTKLGNNGLYIQFPTNFTRAFNTEWIIPIPNTRSTQYQNLKNNYEQVNLTRDITIQEALQSIETAKKNLNNANAQFKQIVGPTRTERIKLQEANILQAKAQAQAILALKNQTIITAPFAGIITKINFNQGERVNAGQIIANIISDDKFTVNVNIAEADINSVNLNDKVNVTFDAYGNEQFEAVVTYISPTATSTNSITAFETTIQFIEQNSKIKAGLTANVDILADSKDNVLAVPARAVFEDSNKNTVVRTIDIGNNVKTIKVQTGLRSSDGKIEIILGLQEGDSVITFLSDKARQYLEINK